MGRWEPDAAGRLQHAAMTLFRERGYAEVTVAEIATRAGLTKRTFFNHFSDKREVLFAGAAAFRASAVAHLEAADVALSPMDAAVVAMTGAGRGLAHYREHAPAVRALIASSTELQERDLIKMAAITADLAEGLQGRGVTTRTARLAAQAAVTAFNAAWDDGVDDPDEDFAALMQRAMAELRSVVSMSSLTSACMPG